MRVIARSTLKKFWENPKYKDSEQSLRAWYFEVKKAKWKNFSEVKVNYPNLSIVGNGRAVFNIKHNKYRLIVKFEFSMNKMFIRFIGTHKQYDNVVAKEV